MFLRARAFYGTTELSPLRDIRRRWTSTLPHAHHLAGAQPALQRSGICSDCSRTRTAAPGRQSADRAGGLPQDRPVRGLESAGRTGVEVEGAHRLGPVGDRQGQRGADPRAAAKGWGSPQHVVDDDLFADGQGTAIPLAHDPGPLHLRQIQRRVGEDLEEAFQELVARSHSMMGTDPYAFPARSAFS